MAVFCGIDWAEGHHDIALVDGEGRLVAKRRISESLDGIAELTAMLAAAGDSAEAPIPVAIETPRGLLVAVLRATGRPIYPINPLAVARYRERTSLSGKKSDHLDAMALANILRTDAAPASDAAGRLRAGPVDQRARARLPGRGVAADQAGAGTARPAARVLPRLPGRVRRRRRLRGGLSTTQLASRRRPRGAGDRTQPRPTA